MMALKILPQDYMMFDTDSLVEFLEKKYAEDYSNLTSKGTDNEILDYYHEREQQRQIVKYTSPIVLLFSTVGNILTLIILLRMCGKVWSTCVYLAILAALDLFLVYTWCGNEWLRVIAFVDLTNELLLSSVSMCKVFTFLFTSMFHMHKWMMVCLSIELFIATKFPKRVPRLCTLSRAKAIILLVTVLVACINMHFFWTFEIVNFNKDQTNNIDLEDTLMCTFVQHSELFVERIWPLVDATFTQTLPFLLVTLFTIMTIVELIKRKGFIDCRQKEWRHKYLLYPHAMKQLKLSVLVICILYILTLPKTVITLYRKTIEMINKPVLFDEKAKFDLTETIFALFLYVFFSLKFYILFISCRQFRAEFYNLCRQICKSRSKSTVNHHTGLNQQKPSFWQKQWKRIHTCFTNTNPERSPRDVIMNTQALANNIYNHSNSLPRNSAEPPRYGQCPRSLSEPRLEQNNTSWRNNQCAHHQNHKTHTMV